MDTACEECGGPVEQSGRGRPRRFCSKKCGWTNYNRKKGHAPKELHTLSEINTETRTAKCSTCGPDTKIWKAGQKRERWRCATRVRAQVSRARVRDPLLERVRKLRSKGVIITVEEYGELVLAADGSCQLCGIEAGLHLDHDHTTGVVRGLLCSTCNTGLGKFGDDPDRLEAAAAYLRAARA